MYSPHILSKAQMCCLGNNGLRSQTLKQITVLVVLRVTLKQSFAFPIFVLGYKNMRKLNVGKFSIQYLLSYPPGTIICLCVSIISILST